MSYFLFLEEKGGRETRRERREREKEENGGKGGVDSISV
jgi:hypothetical protein